MIFINKFSTNFHKNKYHVVIPGLLGFCGLFLSVLFMKSTILSLLFLSLATTGIMCVFPGFWGMTSFLTGRSAAIGIAMINSISNVAGFVSPFAAGNIIDITGSISLAVLLMASFVLAGCLVAQFYEIERQ
jgi:hypothetical protein